MKWLVAGLVLLILVAAGLGAAVWWAQQELQRPVGGDSETIEVASGTSAAGILSELERRGVLSNAFLTRLYLVHRLGDPSLKAGEYRFEEPASAVDVLQRLIDGDVVTYRVTVIEGLTLAETAEHLAIEGFGDVERFRDEMHGIERISDLDPRAKSLEGYLFPDTYHFARGTSEAAIVDSMVQAFRDRIEELRATGALDGDSDVRELVTLASIVEKEAAIDDERPVIAGVYTNRLQRGIALYADPTVIFALKLAGTWDGNIRRPDLKIDSPYNTYRYPGLPPGPICSPGRASLEAAARPADVPYLYFVSRNDGSHVFARTLAEHNRNVDEWQRRYWRERWARERGD